MLEAKMPKTEPIDVAQIRTDFPILDQEVHGRPLVYFDNAATSQKPLPVIEAERDFYLRDNANVHRGVHELSQRATESYEGARTTLAGFINAPRQEEVIFVRGTTEAINLVARSFVAPRLQEGDEVLVTEMEHHSNIVPWQMVCAEKGATLRYIPVDDDGALDLSDLDTLLNERTRFFSFAHVSNALGTINPAKELCDAARAKGIPTMVDGAQAAPHIPVDVQALGCDFYAISSHKMYGPTGIGLLWGKTEHLEAMPPYQGGGDMINRVTWDETSYNVLPYKFEAGTPNIAATIGFAAAADYLDRLGMENVAAHEHMLLEHAMERLSEIPRIRVIGTAPEKAGVISFEVEQIHPHDVGSLLDRAGVAVRTGHHCAQPVMDRFGVPATSRASFGIYNTVEEVDRFVTALKEVIEVFS